MNAHALNILEFEEALNAVAARAVSSVGAAAVRALRPHQDPDALLAEFNRILAVAFLMEDRSQRAPADVPDVREALDRLRIDGSALTGVELHALGKLLTVADDLCGWMGSAPPEALVPLSDRLYTEPALRRSIARTVRPDGTIEDDATPDLAKLRTAMKRAHGKLVGRLEQFVGEMEPRWVVPDASVTIRNGRYVIPLRREGKGRVGGIVHDESATGATVFVEPPVAIELMNRLREMEQEEVREVQRILREFTRTLRPHTHDLMGSFETLVEFDTLYARARTAGAWGGTAPEFILPGEGAAETRLTIVRGRHPLLVESGDTEVVPFDLALGTDERVLVISGPNTGGKSVLLKSIGLISALAQSGVVPPVGPGTRLPVFRDVFADMGDEQSISESLSTFSAHLANVREILESVGPEDLVLMDEIGSGTDPAEGAVLAQAILEDLARRGALTVVTSHLGALKRLDEEGSGIVNGSLEFDAERIEPTYRLVKGRPGRSYGLAIARQLGLPGGVLDRADQLAESGEGSIDGILERLELLEREARERADALAREQSRTQDLKVDLEERGARLSRDEKGAEQRRRAQARSALLDARKEVDAAIREVRAAGADAIEEAARTARNRVEEAARRQEPDRDPSADEARSSRVGPLEPGDVVRVAGSGAQGRIVEVREGRAVVDVRGIRVQVAVSDLSATDAGEQPNRAGGETLLPRTHWSALDLDASPEVDLRGLRVDEVPKDLAHALDRAVMADLGQLKIIHGKGTGAVRQRVTELLREDDRVRDFRIGSPEEGGSGVTLVELT